MTKKIVYTKSEREDAIEDLLVYASEHTFPTCSHFSILARNAYLSLNLGTSADDALEAAQLLAEGYTPGTTAWSNLVQAAYDRMDAEWEREHGDD